MKNPYMPLWVDDFVRGTRLMSLEEQGLYIRLIMELWLVGELPNDHKKIAKLLGLNTRTFTRVFGLIQGKFLVNSEFISHSRVNEERLKMISKSEKAKLNGQKGGIAAANARANATPNAIDSLQQKGSYPDPNPDTDSDLNIDNSPVINTKAETKTPHKAGPKNHKTTPNEAKRGLAISKAINAHSQALETETTQTAPIVKRLFLELVRVPQIGVDADRLLGAILQTRRAQDIKSPIAYCIKLIKNPDFVVADSCLADAKPIVNGWRKERENKDLKAITPDKSC